MRSGGGLMRLRFEPRWLLSSPLVCCSCLVGLAVLAVMARARAALEESTRLHAALVGKAVQLAAEQAAAAYVSSGGVAMQHAFDAGRGIEVLTRVHANGDFRYGMVETRFGGVSERFLFPILTGELPAVFSESFSQRIDGPPLPASWHLPQKMAAGAWPEVDLAGAHVLRDTAASVGVSHDDGIALLRMRLGTERQDFLLGCGATVLQPEIPESGVLHVLGNLWVDRGSRQLVLQLSDSLTIVVDGNVYIGRSVVVRGEGQLTIVTRAVDGASFADRDGDGRFGPGDELRGGRAMRGPEEGAGSVYLGLPNGRGGDLVVGASVVAEGELHVAVDRARLGGSLMLGQGGTVLPGAAGGLEVAGRAIRDRLRAGLPGFVVRGQPRPGRLRPEGDQPLYRPGSSR